MKNEEVVSINGRRYDKDSGKSINNLAKKSVQIASKPVAVSARNIHSGLQKSQTLVRKAVKKPEGLKVTTGRSMDIARSARISRFAEHPVIKETFSKKEEPMSSHTPHPIVAKVKNNMSAPAVAAVATPQPITIAKSKIEADSSEGSSSWKKYGLFTLAVIAVILGAVYAYYNVPAISVRIAASQAGISASYPGFVPDGFRMTGPIVADGDSVVIKYNDSSNDNFTIRQKSWSGDSTAVADTIASQWQNNQSMQANGLSIYSTTSYDKIAWVNHGILYTITGNANLDFDKVKRIALSL